MEWKQKIGTDEYGQSIYTTAVTIKGRMVGKTRRNLDKHGTMINTSCYVLTQANVRVLDMIDDEVVIDTIVSVDKYGNSLATECYI